jgi:hypothetical protein
MIRNTICYRLWNEGLGDHWASLNLLAHMCLISGKPIAYSHPQKAKIDRAGVILDLLDLSHMRRFIVGHADQKTEDLDGFDVWATPYFATRVRWSLQGMVPTLCVHFDGISTAHDKNPSKDEQEQILAWAAARGLRVVVLGDPAMPLQDMIKHLATCALFVGCDSGPSHVAHSVGCPTYLLEYNLPVVTCHRHKNYVLCKGAGHFTQQGDNWLHFVRHALGLLPRA